MLFGEADWFMVNTCVTSNATAGAIHVHAFGFVLATPTN
jgi:hypothetical protein